MNLKFLGRELRASGKPSRGMRALRDQGCSTYEVLLLVEASLVGFIAVDHRWEEDLPIDPTGQLDSLRYFIEENIDICKWVGILVLVIQALSLILALILRATVFTWRSDSDYEDEYDVEGRIWEPLLNPQSGEPDGSSKVDSRAIYSDIWSSRIREKVC
ncbi:hypothetical protein TanjilG_10074 [Lupinus angustifolius]|uniref:Uncharacterized protein n=1 Tax=Lupinus angustifolius TaxID=3871 RepID=A0A1J7GZA2_LUPAN|nr:hypothetical protein TanjilG_10074 [Lupinus angustifolius]